MKKWFVLFLICYLLVYIPNRLGFVYPFLIQNYFNDLIAVPVMAPLSVWMMRYLTNDQGFVLEKWQVVYIVVMLSVCFELIIPVFSFRYTADILDVLMYSVGGYFYWKKMNQVEHVSAPQKK